MPNLPTHVHLARRVAERVANPIIDDNLGAFLLGSTAPDVRAITKQPREAYHFAPLDFERVGDGVRAMMDAHPRLSDLDRNGPAAFMAGYVSHIVLDECWIVEMFRPLFGANGSLGGARGQVLDRALQLELDRRAQDSVAVSLDAMRTADAPLGLGFLSDDTISEWRAWVVEFLARDFSWERLRFMARRIAMGDESHPAHAAADDFLESMPASLEALFEIVSPGDLDEFTRRSVDTLRLHIESYLS